MSEERSYEDIQHNLVWLFRQLTETHEDEKE